MNWNDACRMRDVGMYVPVSMRPKGWSEQSLPKPKPIPHPLHKRRRIKRHTYYSKKDKTNPILIVHIFCWQTLSCWQINKNKYNTLMITPQFKLPKTKMSLVLWYRQGQKNEVLIQTPVSCSALANTMFMQHRVGPSEIRAVKPVEPAQLLGQRF